MADVAPQQPAPTKEGHPDQENARRRHKRLPREGNKTSRVIAMLRREGGATLEEIMSAMAWQQHTTRALMSAGGALAKKHGQVVTSEKVGDQRTYFIKGSTNRRSFFFAAGLTPRLLFPLGLLCGPQMGFTSLRFPTISYWARQT